MPGSSSRGSRSEAARDREPDVAPAALEAHLERRARAGRRRRECRARDAVGVAELAAQELAELAPEHPPRAHARDALGGRVPARDAVVGVGRHDRVGDLGEDRLARVLLLRDALVQERVAQRHRRRAGQGGEAVDLVGAEAARGARVHGEHALDLAVRCLHGHPEVGRESRVAHDRIVRQARVGRQVGYRHRCRSREGLGGDRIARERAAVREQIGGIAEHGARDQLAALEQAKGACVGLEQVGGLRDDLTQHGARLEIGREQG